MSVIHGQRYVVQGRTSAVVRKACGVVQNQKEKKEKWYCMISKVTRCSTLGGATPNFYPLSHVSHIHKWSSFPQSLKINWIVSGYCILIEIYPHVNDCGQWELEHLQKCSYIRVGSSFASQTLFKTLTFIQDFEEHREGYHHSVPFRLHRWVNAGLPRAQIAACVKLRVTRSVCRFGRDMSQFHMSLISQERSRSEIDW